MRELSFLKVEQGLPMRFEKRFENGYVSMDISPGMLRTVRGWDRESRELWLEIAHKISGKPIEVLRREMLLGGLRLIRGGKA